MSLIYIRPTVARQTDGSFELVLESLRKIPIVVDKSKVYPIMPTDLAL